MNIEGNVRNILTIGAYLLFFILIMGIIDTLFIPGLLSTAHFLTADALHYHWISQHGYEAFRTAFFPLFPFLWHVLPLGIHGISIFNALIFLVCFFFLARYLKPTTAEILIYLSIPGFLFFYLPYSEATFFAAATLLLIGLKKDNPALTVSGLFLAALARPAFSVLLPALVLAELLGRPANRKMAVRLFLYTLAALAGTFVVSLVSYHYTGSWFEFIKAQKNWGNVLQLPGLPLTSWGGLGIITLDAGALLIGLASGTVLLLQLFSRRFRKKYLLPDEVLLSLGYLAGITISVLAFRSGSLFSLNRFVLATPFLVVALNHWLGMKLHLTYRQIVLGFLIIFAIFFILYMPYSHILTLLRFFFLSAYLVLLLILKVKNEWAVRISVCLLIGLNLFFQLYFFTRFLLGGWVG